MLLGHVIEGFFWFKVLDLKWGFLDRAPRSRVLCSSEFKGA